jgi:hypothetical protein
MLKTRAPLWFSGIEDIAFLLGAILCFLFTSLKDLGPAPIDDTYIFFRYADNFAAGHGLVWNIGEAPTDGATSILWVLMLGYLHRLTAIGTPELADWLGIGCGVLTLCLSWVAARQILARHHRGYAAVAPLLLAASPIYARHADSGMETMLGAAIVMMVATLWTWRGMASRYRYPATAVLSALAVFNRPDALVICGLGTVIVAGLEGGPRWRARCGMFYLLPLGVLIGAMLVWKYSYYGSVIPLPAYMKVGLGHVFSNPRLIRWIVSSTLEFFGYVAPVAILAYMPAVLLPSKYAPAVVAMLTSAAVYILVFLTTVVPVMNIAGRYGFPVLPLLAVAAAYGLRLLTSIPSRERRWWNPDGAVGTFVVVAAMVCEWGNYHFVKSEARDTVDALRPNIALGKALQEIPDISVAWSEAGTAAYYSDHRFLDLGGLNDAFIARNRGTPDMPERFASYLTQVWGLPSVYVEPAPEYDYALMENQPTIRAAYHPVPIGRFTAYVLNDSPAAAALTERLSKLNDDLVATREAPMADDR